jgi:hypothetical protein
MLEIIIAVIVLSLFIILISVSICVIKKYPLKDENII